VIFLNGDAMGVISLVAGAGTPGDSGDDGPAVGAQLFVPVGVAVIPGGGFLIADTGNNVVRMVSLAGVITRVAGTGTPGDSGDDGPATAAQLNLPTGVAVIPAGGFLIADTGNNVVRMVSPAGVITRVAGTGTPGDRGDDGRATAAQLNVPEGVAVIPDGGFLIADTGNNVVRMVSLAGVITRVAGTGTPGDSGDDGPATDATLNVPLGVAVIPGGGFLIADAHNNVVRMVSPAGVITRVAGTGTPGDSGDDGPATGAQLNDPIGVAVIPNGGFLIADTRNNMVRMVSPAGVITRVAGTGTPGDSGDGGPATGAQLHDPRTIAVTPDGGFLIADSGNHVVRKVAPVG
jgi:glucose/arabinose dehydrogenase